MQIYSNADLTLIPVPYRQHTLGALTQGFTVTNYSDVSFQVSSNTTGDLGVIPPYFARTFGCKAGDTIQFIPSDLQTAALPQTIMFLNVDESGGGVIPSQTPLAQVPGYALDVQGSVSLSGVGQVAIQGTPTVAFAAGQTVSIGNTPSVSISSGSVNATIQNASLNSTITNALITSNPSALLYNNYPFTITNLAANSSINVNGTPISIPLVLVDSIQLTIVSSLGDPSLLYKVTNITAYNNIPNSNLGVSNVQFISASQKTANYKIDLPYPFLTNNVLFFLQNISGSTIVSDPIKFYIVIKYASQTTTPTILTPVYPPTTNWPIGAASALQLVAPDTTKRLKSFNYIATSNAIGNQMVYFGDGHGGSNILLTAFQAGQSGTVYNSVSFNLDLKDGIPLDNGLWVWTDTYSNTIHMIGGYASIAPK